MKLSFHGAAQGVTGSCHLLECNGKRILIDCGFYQGGRELEEDNADDFGFDAEFYRLPVVDPCAPRPLRSCSIAGEPWILPGKLLPRLPAVSWRA